MACSAGPPPSAGQPSSNASTWHAATLPPNPLRSQTHTLGPLSEHPPKRLHPTQVVSPAQALFLDPRTGQVLSPAAAPQGSPWLGGPAGLQAVHAGQVVSIGGRPVQLLGAGPQAVQYIAVQGPHGVHALALPPGMQLVQGMPQGGAASPGGRGRASAKRKRGPPTGEGRKSGRESIRRAQMHGVAGGAAAGCSAAGLFP